MIHNNLKHRNRVEAIGMFEVDQDTYCAVLVYCDGGDLSWYMRRIPRVSERDAAFFRAKCVFHHAEYPARDLITMT